MSDKNEFQKFRTSVFPCYPEFKQMLESANVDLFGIGESLNY